MTRVIVWNARSKTITGQQIVTDAAAKIISENFELLWRGEFPSGTFSGIPRYTLAVLKLWWLALTRPSVHIYFPPSRSTIGFIRDLPVLLLPRKKLTFTAHVHGSDILDLLRVRWYSAAARTIYRRVHFVAPSTHISDALNQILPGSVALCENFLNPNTNQNPLLANSGDAERLGAWKKMGLPLILWNSNLMGTKGFAEFADAVRLVNSAQTKAFVVALGKPLGDSELTQAEVQGILEKLMLEPWFVYAGSVGPSHSAHWAEISDICVLPSRRECQPLALVEAMCAGCAVVVSSDEGVMATLEDYPGLVVDSTSPIEIAGALLDTIACHNRDPDGFRAKLKKAATRQAERFSFDKFQRQLVNAIKKSLERKV